MTKNPISESKELASLDASSAVPFWKRIEGWLDRLFRLTPPLDPNEVDGILLEDRILYSATPMAILDGGENAPPESSFTPEMIEEAIAFFEQINQISRVDEPSSILPESEDSSQEELTYSERSNLEEGPTSHEIVLVQSDSFSTRDVLSYLEGIDGSDDIDQNRFLVERMESGFEQIDSLLAQYDSLDTISITQCDDEWNDGQHTLNTDAGGLFYLDNGLSLNPGENLCPDHQELAYLGSEITATPNVDAILLTR
ncbi:MAG: hypothetical protein MUC43_19270, partial [Pirellula sp.]|nr:hypothetical protein [Pirellula sp.]